MPSPRSLRLRLTVLYAALFCACALLLGAFAVVFKPGFLVRSSYAGIGRGSHQVSRPWDGSLGRFLAGFTAHHNVGGGAALILILLVLAAAAGWLIAGRVVKPLRVITASARAISASNLHERLALKGPGDEFAELGETLDDLFARLEASFESQRRFVANASHELRTPLAAGRTVLQVALADPDADAGTLREACEEVLDLGERQERLIDALLTLASSERGVEQWEPFDLAEIARTVVLHREPEAGDLGIEVSTSFDAAPVKGDRRLAEILVANLVDNALRHNVPGGTVDIGTAIAGDLAVLSVSNTGGTVPPGELGRLFQPFRRAGDDRLQHAAGQGHGLGLAIVRAVADAHDAEITTTARPAGGLDIQVSFPVRR